MQTQLLSLLPPSPPLSLQAKKKACAYSGVKGKLLAGSQDLSNLAPHDDSGDTKITPLAHEADSTNISNEDGADVDNKVHLAGTLSSERGVGNDGKMRPTADQADSTKMPHGDVTNADNKASLTASRGQSTVVSKEHDVGVDNNMRAAADQDGTGTNNSARLAVSHGRSTLVEDAVSKQRRSHYGGKFTDYFGNVNPKCANVWLKPWVSYGCVTEQGTPYEALDVGNEDSMYHGNVKVSCGNGQTEWVKEDIIQCSDPTKEDVPRLEGCWDAVPKNYRCSGAGYDEDGYTCVGRRHHYAGLSDDAVPDDRDINKAKTCFPTGDESCAMMNPPARPRLGLYEVYPIPTRSSLYGGAGTAKYPLGVYCAQQKPAGWVVNPETGRCYDPKNPDQDCPAGQRMCHHQFGECLPLENYKEVDRYELFGPKALCEKEAGMEHPWDCAQYKNGADCSQQSEGCGSENQCCETCAWVQGRNDATGVCRAETLGDVWKDVGNSFLDLVSFTVCTSAVPVINSFKACFSPNPTCTSLDQGSACVQAFLSTVTLPAAAVAGGKGVELVDGLKDTMTIALNACKAEGCQNCAAEFDIDNIDEWKRTYLDNLDETIDRVDDGLSTCYGTCGIESTTWWSHGGGADIFLQRRKDHEIMH